LRLERQGNQLIGSVSTDGQQWRVFQPIQVTYPAKVRVGIEAVNAAQQPHQIRFENFQLDKN
jgi:regulation of enolase protein 1 (concanavalin A-like superfamily)